MTAVPGPSRSFEEDGSSTRELSGGQVAHAAHIDQSNRLERRLTAIRPGVWCLTGNGLSNQVFIEGPEGIIAIDTGESVEEMDAALDELRTVSDRPVVGVLYTHFHYVAGTAAVVVAAGGRAVPVFGHARIEFNRSRTASEIAPAYSRGIVEQFGLALPDDGPDGLVNVGLGRFFRDRSHAPFTPGFVPPTNTFEHACTISVAGLDVEVMPAPSDSDDSVTYWFPSLSVVVNNLVWPALFNVFAIRGEEYRDPRVVVTGLDHLLSLGADHLVGTHGPPISGADAIARRVTRYRDAIQFLWDQTVRLANKGLTGVEIAHAVRLPDHCDNDHLTSEYYGVAEHHVRQIRNGLFGFFDGDESQLFPLDTTDRADRMLGGFGGRDAVRQLAAAAIEDDDLRWALELCSWLVHSDDAEQADRVLLARALKIVAQRSSAANIRNWCLTRALQLEGVVDGSRYRTHRLQRAQVTADPVASVQVLRVLLDPVAAEGIDTKITWDFDGVGTTGIHLRHSIACPCDGSDGDVTLSCDPTDWSAIVAGGAALSEAITAGKVRMEGNIGAGMQALRCFELIGLRS